MTPGDRQNRDRWLRDTLRDAVVDVEPRSDLGDVRSRLEEDAGAAHRRTGWATAAAGVAVAATVATVAFAAGVGPSDDSTGDATGPAASPSAIRPTVTSSSADEDLPRLEGPLPVYYVGDTPNGPRLYREFRAPMSERGDALATALQMAVSRPPDDPDYRIPWPDGVEAAGSVTDGLVTVELTAPFVDMELIERPSGMPPGEAQMALQQLIYTAQAAVQDRAPVRFLLDGQPVDRLLGVSVAEPLTEGDPMQVQGPVWIIAPQDGDEVDGSLQVEGRGAFFEANVAWQVLQDGDVVKEGFATAEECCTLSPFRFEVAGLPPGDYVLRVYDADMSGGEGPGEHEDTKRFTLTG